MSTQENLVAVCQMTSRNNKSENLKTCRNLIEKASLKGAKMVFLPEACDYIGESRTETLQLAEPLNGPLVNQYQTLAKQFNVWISLGGIHERISDEKVRNAHVIINSGGEIVAVYHKTHLFDIDMPDKSVRLRESDYVEPGKQIVPPVLSPVGNVGLCVCYDMRFPEMGIALRGSGAHILTYPSAFTASTGAAHWEALLKARAIETQCYVIAAAQTGQHNAKRASWGHAMVVDPWGTVIAQCSEGVSVVTAGIDLCFLEQVKTKMPIWNHRRFDLYRKISLDKNLHDQMPGEPYQFGQCIIKDGQVFYQTEYTFAFTNKRCVLPGHVLVAPKRCAKRLVDLSEEEIRDLFVTATSVQKVVERCYLATSSTICVQDGKDAGQTVEHVHVHIIPRKPGDFARNDDIYGALEMHDKQGSDREESEMFAEAVMLRRFFS
ncbi:Uncharacterized protein GBIM_13306 [Gryllus bimaculatus]|nr:Uncharacterized protein GBIM_13306 [Gryllus bimaculatus]